MPRVVFKHIRNTDNIGDRSCCPADHLAFDDAVAMDLDEPTPPCDAVVFGGGKIFGSLASKMTPNDRLARQRIAWGVSTVQSSVFAFRYALSRRQMSMVGSRDYGDARYDYAPCVTCMSPLFDQAYETRHDLVFYLHKTKSQELGLDIPAGAPVLDNFCDSMEAAIEFIGSGDVVVSNSYHGVYWALLLGKKVLCLPFSKKFAHYRLPPGYSTPTRWQKDAGKAVAQPDMLAICRHASRTFEHKVRVAIA
jgi:hypothetical protein